LSDLIVELTSPTCTRITHAHSSAVLLTAMAPEYGGTGGAFSSTDLVAAALGSCIATNLGPLAERHGIPLGAIRLTVRKQLTPPPKRIGRLEVTVQVNTPLSAELRTRFESAAASCTVHRSLHPDLVCELQFEYT
jgi:putative redox protein